jgi:hypothetical protein
MLANVETGVITEIFKTGEKNQTPSITRLPHNEFLLAKDEISIFVGLDSKPTRKYGLRWNQQPVNLEMIEPYCLAITPQSVDPSLFLVLSGHHTTVSQSFLFPCIVWPSHHTTVSQSFPFPCIVWPSHHSQHPQSAPPPCIVLPGHHSSI